MLNRRRIVKEFRRERMILIRLFRECVFRVEDDFILLQIFVFIVYLISVLKSFCWFLYFSDEGRLLGRRNLNFDTQCLGFIIVDYLSSDVFIMQLRLLRKTLRNVFFFFEFGFLDRVIVVYLVMRNSMNLIFNFFFMLNIIFLDSFFFGQKRCFLCWLSSMLNRDIRFFLVWQFFRNVIDFFVTVSVGYFLRVFLIGFRMCMGTLLWILGKL